MSPSSTTRKSSREFLDQLLREQNELFTPVAEFTHAHQHGKPSNGAGRFSRLVPLTPPAAGEQYAFEVVLDKCSGCKACVTACHSLNGLDENETWREVGLLVEELKPRRNAKRGIRNAEYSALRTPHSALQHITTACHHCIDPACLNGCPVLAYEKDPATGIVRHLDDQCIGCQYCILKCPYDAPKYNARLGIVRKCDMCADRLAADEAPACAQACPNEAIRITKVQAKTISTGFRDLGATFLAGAPAGDYTVPTTRFTRSATRSEENGCRIVAADFAELKPQPPHWPLVFMLVLTQASVGGVAASLLPELVLFRKKLLLLSIGFAATGMAASLFHLGRPLGAWRAFLNLRRSWMSREVVAFAAFAVLLLAAVIEPRLTVAAMLVGVLAVFCSAMIYADTQRELWRAQRSISLFFVTTAMFGAATAILFVRTGGWPGAALPMLTFLKLALEVSVVRHNTDGEITPMRKTALLIVGRFRHLAWLRCAVALAGGICGPLLLNVNLPLVPQAVAVAGITLLAIGELAERYLFFRCAAPLKMPGGLS